MFGGLRLECRRRFLDVAEKSGDGAVLKNDGKRGKGGAWEGEGTERFSAAELLTGSL